MESRQTASVPFLDLSGMTSAVRDDVQRRWDRILTSSQFVLGRECTELETRFAAVAGCAYCVTVSSGTDALRLALEALGTKRGDIVVCPANTFIATCAGASVLGADVRLVEPTETTCTIDADAVEALAIALRAQGKKIHAVMVVHLYGHPADMERLCSLSAEYGFEIVEDCAQAHGASYRGKPVGSFGAIACFSFYPGKNLGAFGDGGAVTTNREDLARQVRLLRNHGSPTKYQHDIVGHCNRLDEIQAAVLNAKLSYLPRWTEDRRRVAASYDELLAGVRGVETLRIPDDRLSAFHLYVVRISAQKRDQLRDHLLEQGIETLIHYPVPVHLHGAYRHLNLGPGTMPIAERLAGEIVSLPLYPDLPREQIAKVAAAIKRFMEG